MPLPPRYWLWLKQENTESNWLHMKWFRFNRCFAILLNTQRAILYCLKLIFDCIAIKSTYVLVVARPIIHGRAILIKNTYGFLRVKTNKIRGRIINCCIAIPAVTVTTNIPNCWKTDSISDILAIDTAIRLVIPIGVSLK